MARRLRCALSATSRKFRLPTLSETRKLERMPDERIHRDDALKHEETLSLMDFSRPKAGLFADSALEQLPAHALSELPMSWCGPRLLKDPSSLSDTAGSKSAPLTSRKELFFLLSPRRVFAMRTLLALAAPLLLAGCPSENRIPSPSSPTPTPAQPTPTAAASMTAATAAATPASPRSPPSYGPRPRSATPESCQCTPRSCQCDRCQCTPRTPKLPVRPQAQSPNPQRNEVSYQGIWTTADAQGQVV
mgnify:CR=1 FL=1